jgi:hypothetical protein
MLKFNLKQTTFFLLLFASFFSYAQNLTGVVSSVENKPLPSANVIARPLLDSKQQLKFAIADNLGRYRLELDPNVKYVISVSYIGFLEEVFLVEPNSKNATHNFLLKSTGQNLKEIVIKHNFNPVIIKKDTLVFDIKSFANGDERKMKDILKKLPGVEVDKRGNIFVQGKKVTKLLVEGKSFFGGGSKLAVENIPADALEKIEVLDHFTNVGFMKQVSDSEDLAMNVKLKANKKKFVFGDVTAGAEVAGDKGFYQAHAGLFYYSPKTSLSYIGDCNNIGKSVFTFEDLLRFDGGVSSYLSGRKSLGNLYSLANDNTDLVINKSQFSALNFSVDVSSKIAVSGYAIFSKSLTESKIESRNQYLQNTFFSSEKKSENNNSKSLLGIGNIKIDYSPSSLEKWFYNGQFQANNSNVNNLINSITNVNSNLFESINSADNSTAKQYLEWHKRFNNHHTTTFVVNQAFEKNTPQNQWFNNQLFLSGLIPLQNDSNYLLEQIKKIKSNSVDVLFKHYWIINNFNHLYSVMGNNFGNSNFETSEKQILTNGVVNDFSSAGFSNNVKYTLNDSYLGLEYKFKLGRWTNKPGIYLHNYDLKTNQISGNNSLSKTLFQPQWNSDFVFSESESLNFTYKLSNTFPDVNQFANQFTLQGYNSVFKGNSLLQNEQFHTANLRYSKINLYRGLNWNINLNYNKKIQTLRNEIVVNGINQYNTPFLTNNPETNLMTFGSVSYKIYRFRLKLNSNLSWNNYIQTINNFTTSNDRNSQRVGISLKTAYNKWNDFNIGYTKGFNQLSGLTKTEFKTEEFNVDYEFKIRKDISCTIEYENLKNTNSNNQKNFFDVANATIKYEKKDSPFTFELIANNVLDTKVKNNYNFSDFLISEQSTFVLPRVFLLSISYKL